jgi:hypothetical protein
MARRPTKQMREIRTYRIENIISELQRKRQRPMTKDEFRKRLMSDLGIAKEESA